MRIIFYSALTALKRISYIQVRTFDVEEIRYVDNIVESIYMLYFTPTTEKQALSKSLL